MAALAASPCTAEIKWASSFDAAIAEAKRSNKVVMVDMYTDWCGWCKRLDATTYKDPKVTQIARQMVSVKVNAEKEGVAVARKYGVSSYPTILFVDKTGAVESTIHGYEPPEQFAKSITEIIAEHRDVPGLEQKVKSGTVDGTGAARLAKVYAKRGQPSKAVNALTVAERLQSNGTQATLTETYLLLGNGYGRANDLTAARKFFTKATRSAQRPNDLALARLGLVACLFQEKKYKEATPILNSVTSTKGLPPQLAQAAQQMLAYAKSNGR
jgi:thioredoxin-like negative regulator of GroEL